MPGNQDRTGIFTARSRPRGYEEAKRLGANQDRVPGNQTPVPGDSGRRPDLIRPGINIKHELADVGWIEVKVWRHRLSSARRELNVLWPF